MDLCMTGKAIAFFQIGVARTEDGDEIRVHHQQRSFAVIGMVSQH
jgi:hypothetical protein